MRWYGIWPFVRHAFASVAGTFEKMWTTKRVTSIVDRNKLLFRSHKVYISGSSIHLA